MEPTVSPASLRGPKISKACEECRRRKQKCNGLNPCSICVRRGTHCSYRTFIRRRAGARNSQRAGTTTSDGDNSRETSHPRLDESSRSADTITDVPPRYQIFSSMRATYPHDQSPSCVLQLYYGSSSNFSFLQHLHAHLTQQEEGDAPEHEVQNGNPGLDFYKYQGLAFGGLMEQQRGRDANPMFLRHDLARMFLQNYLSTAQHFLPFLSPEQLCANFDKLYGSGDDAAVESSDRAIVLAAMAIGSCPTNHEMWKKTLLAQARTEAEAMVHIVNLRAVQIALLMISRPNSAYLYLGSAVRKAYAAGLHRGSANNQASGSESTEANKTCWSLFCYEQLICFSLGRPSSFSQADIGIPLPERTSFLSALVRLCEIIHSTQQSYQHHDATVGADLRASHRIRQRLRSFAQSIKEDLQITIGGPLPQGEKLVMHTVISYLYNNTLLLAFRPFVLLYVELKKRENSEVEPRYQNEKKPPITSLPWLLEACEYTAEAARAIITLSESVFSVDMGAEGIYNHAFFLESASFVLILASLHDDRSPARHLRYVSRAIKSLRQILPREPILSIISAIEQMLTKVQALNGSAVAAQSSGSSGSSEDPTDTSIKPGSHHDNTLTLPPLLGQSQESQGRESTVRDGQMASPSILLQQSMGPVPSDYITPPGFGTGALDVGAQAAGPGSEILEAEWPTMDWDFDLSTLDMESFVSVMGGQNAGLHYNI